MATHPATGNQPPPAPPGRSIGRFLCHHPVAPPYEDVSELPLGDIKQEAALRAWLMLTKLGVEIGDDFVAALDASPHIAALAYRRAYNDALRAHLGRGRLPVGRIRPRRGPRSASLAALLRPFVVRFLSTLTHGHLNALRDPAQEAALDAVVEDAPGEVERLERDGIDGLSVPQSRQVISLMRRAQEHKDRHRPIPKRLRQQIYRLREKTGLPLRLDLL